MKNNPPSTGPDLESIIGNLTKPAQPKTEKQSEMAQQEPEDNIEDIALKTECKGRLWDEFIETLNDQDEAISERSKLYAIDDDIVETLKQCSFGSPNVAVINGILRTFLIDNLHRLRAMLRTKQMSLLDKYE